MRLALGFSLPVLQYMRPLFKYDDTGSGFGKAGTKNDQIRWLAIAIRTQLVFCKYIRFAEAGSFDI
jgi:hypothetical protein